MKSLKNKDFDDMMDSLNQKINSIGENSKEKTSVTINLVDIGKKYEGNSDYTLENINLEIKAGEFCVFLGPSGCGKTTLLRMIAGLNSITKGELQFNGKRYNNLLPSERDIAMVFQSYALYPHMNSYNNMAFGLKLSKEPKDVINKTVKNAAKILNIESQLYKKPSDLSGGQRQRVAIGRAIVNKPSVFLMDEPLSNLDAKLREQMRRELVEIHRMLNTTSIYVTHDQLEAMTMADRIVVFNDGKIQQNGTPKELYFKPSNLFVASFIGSPTMNIYDAHFDGKKIISNSCPTIKPIVKNSLFKKLKIGQKLKIGIRTENINIETKKIKDYSETICHSVEVLGKEQLLILKDGKSIYIANCSNTLEIKYNQKIYIKFDEKYYHIFDSITGERL